ncbi:DUF5105 domain-containing protein [Leptotrichia sp. HSP-342]|uniref:DUF5105 domain-containing protein n=1 Tax=Leptotrichia mesophila TaxID=3239303 RepID=A0AB39V8Q8_9FUSO
MKKLLLILTMLLFIFSCGTPQPQKDLESALKALQSGDEKKIQELYSSSETLDNDDSAKIMREGYKKLSYKVKSTKVEGDKATINLDIKSPDLSSYFPEFLQKGILIQAANPGKSDEEITKMGEEFTVKFFLEKINSKDLKFSEKNIDVVLKKVNGKWKIDG